MMSNNGTADHSRTGRSCEPDEVDLWVMVAAERRRLADELAGLTADQWQTASKCDAWSVRDVVAHLVTPFRMTNMKFVFTLIKHRANFDKTMIDLASETAARFNTMQLVDVLRDNAANRWAPPGSGAEIPLAEVVVHGQDIRRALGLRRTVPDAVVERTLEGIDDAELRADYRRRIGV